MTDATGVAERVRAILRGRLEGLQGLSEKRMFGGVCFLLNGNMLCGVHGPKHEGAAMFRVGKAAQAEALALPGVRPMAMTGRVMGGLAELPAEDMEDPARWEPLLAFALGFVGSLPPK